MRVLIFGDSITQGYWAIEHGWVDRLREYFDRKQITDLENNNEPSVFNLGISADTSEDVLLRVKNEITSRTRVHHAVKPVIILQIGINDSSIDHGKRRVLIDEFKKNLNNIVAGVDRLTSQIIFVGSSACDESKTKPVFWGDYYYDNKSIKEYEEAMKEVATANKLPLIEIFDEFYSALNDGKDLLADGLHPNDAGHALMFNIVKPNLRELLK